MQLDFLRCAERLLSSPQRPASARRFGCPGDRDPTPEERSQIERVLRAKVSPGGDEIEFEDAGHWEVDDAVAADGRKYDLTLNGAFAIIERKLD